MPCNYFGKIIPGGDRASCVAGGGTWVPEPSLNQPPLIEPSLMRRPPGMTRPDSDLGSGPMNLPTRPLGISYPGGSALQDPAKVSLFHSDTDDFGNPLSTDFAGQSFYDKKSQRQSLLDDMAFSPKKEYTEAEKEAARVRGEYEYDPGKWSRENPGATAALNVVKGGLEFADPTGDIRSVLETITDPELRAKFIKTAQENPKLTGTAILGAWAASKSKKLRQAANWITKNRYKKADKIGKKKKNIFGKADDKKSKAAGEERNIFNTSTYKEGAGKNNLKLGGDLGKAAVVGYYGQKGFNELAEEPLLKDKLGNIPTDSTIKSGDINIFNDEEKSKRPEDEQGPLNEGGIWNPSELTKAAKTGNIDKGLLDKMGTKDFWMTGIEGGAGGWDNRLFRLGEMMAYMGTPLSKRGKNPAARWTAANTEQSKIKAAIEKARLEAGKGETGKALTFPQFTGNFDKALTTFAEGTWNPFDNYSEEQMANVRLKAWKVHEKNPTSTIEDILNALLAEGQI